MRKPENQPSSESSIARRRLTKALGLALALHAPLVLYGRIQEVWHERNGITHAAREEAKSILNEHGEEKREYIGELKKALERGEPIDLGEFYLKTEYLEGRADKARMELSADKLGTVERELRADMEVNTITQNLQEIRNQQGRYSRIHSYLSSPLLEGEGNCQARERFSAAVINRLYPEMKMAYQTMKLEGEIHTRTLVEIEGRWRSMETPDVPLSDADLEGTVLYDKYDYVRHYVGEKGLGHFESEAGRHTKSYTKLSVTDNYLHLPLPDGISSDDIKDFGSESAGRRNGMGLGSIGSTATKDPQDPEANQNSLASGGRDYVKNAIELELYTPEVIQQNRQKTEVLLNQLKALNSSDDEVVKIAITQLVPGLSDPCAQAYVPLMRMGVEEIYNHCRVDEASGMYPCNIGFACADCINTFSYERRLKRLPDNQIEQACEPDPDYDALRGYRDTFGLFDSYYPPDAEKHLLTPKDK